ncbi:RnfABCDGE type electron transport complex subunit B [Geoalkalibacter halelectricus]|uniref:Ion-translocating oxidoreductase complex subunit B n=1 Tax=Geoalkalibacter halelectricus TaxID=2847045 RepID=A0ABY5ZFX1_9BACT|nr:RnfABCDGE type electron transport complex subunit B [Geoalkalibacter halelectricus]MDO3378155.1 RnfABCDGE type electron transport complex subunit B [Geoalkalibacter halelectricus]UWZ78001.1 RnfABCDGE type electron transport complex subunit B [Geoalkalibacter halelectricus]
MLAAILSLGGIGLIAAIILGLAAKKFAVEVDPRELALLDALPGANCGACGYPGCSGFARALAEGRADPADCTPGGKETVAEIARILGVAATSPEPRIAVVLCQGDRNRAADKYRYLGIEDCNAAQKLAEGPKQCPGGCLGLGSCRRVCPFGAIEITPAGLAVISRELCTGCTKCVAVCPREVIRMTPAAAEVHVLCNSHDKGAVVRKYCSIGCIACHICHKAAPQAYVIEDFLARVDYAQGAAAAAAVDKCPTKCIRDFARGYPEGCTFGGGACAAPSDVAA